MRAHRPRSRRPRGLRALSLAGVVALGLVAGQIPRAKLQNLREVHTATGAMSYRGNVQGDLGYALSRALGSAPVQFGDAELFGGEAQIPDPLKVDLENQVALGRLTADDPLTRGIQVEAFGWLAVDDQYVLGRERSVLELGKHLAYLDMDSWVAPPAEPAGVDELSPLLAGLARAGLGALPAGVEAPLATDTPDDLQGAMDAVRALDLDRDGALRALAVANILIERSTDLFGGSIDPGLVAFARELRVEVVGQALYAAARDDDPLVRAACVRALGLLPDGIPGSILRPFVADPSGDVSAEALRYIAERGLPVDDLLLAGAERDSWVEVLLAFAQIPDGRRSAFACAALSRISGADLDSLRPEDWTAWWRETYPERPVPALSATAGT